MSFQLIFDICLHAITEIRCIFDHSFPIQFSKQFFVYFCIDITFDFFDDKTIVFTGMFGFFFRYTQHSSKIGLVRVCFHCIELHFLTCFFTLESIYSFFIFHVEYRHRSIFVFDTSFFHISVSVQFDQFPFQVFGTFDLIYSDHVTVVFTDAFDLFVDHFIVNFDGIERYFFTFAHFGIHLRRQSDIIQEFEIFILQVQFLLFSLVRKRFAQNLKVILLDVVIQRLSQNFIDFIYQ